MEVAKQLADRLVNKTYLILYPLTMACPFHYHRYAGLDFNEAEVIVLGAYARPFSPIPMESQWWK